MKNKFILGIISVFALFIFESCDRTVDGGPQSLVVTNLLTKDTTVFGAKTVTYVSAKVTDPTGGKRITKIVITPTVIGGLEPSHMKDGVLTIKNHSDGDVKKSPIQTTVWPIEITRSQGFGTNQSFDYTFEALTDAPNGSSCSMKMQFFYTNTDGTTGSVSVQGPTVNFQNGSFNFSFAKQAGTVSAATKQTPDAGELTVVGDNRDLNALEFEYEGRLGNETITEVRLVTKEGVYIATAQNQNGKFIFPSLTENISGTKTYIPKLVFNQDVRTGDIFSLKLTKIITKERWEGGKTHTLNVNNNGTTFTTLKALLSAEAKMLNTSVFTNGVNTVSRTAFTAEWGDVALAQFFIGMTLSDNNALSTLEVANLKVYIDGFPISTPFFSKVNGDTMKVYSETDTAMYISLWGGIIIPAGKTVVVEVRGECKGFGRGDGIATILLINDNIDYDGRRHLTRSETESRFRLSTTKSFSDSAPVPTLAWSDFSGYGYSATPGTSSPNWGNGYSVKQSSKTKLFYTYLEHQ